MSEDKIKKLAAIKEKMMALRQDEEKICAEITQNLSAYLIKAGALDVDLEMLIGGNLGLIEKIKKGHPETEVWKQAGQKFCQVRRNRKAFKAPPVEKKAA